MLMKTYLMELTNLWYYASIGEFRLLGSSAGKEAAYNAGDPGLIPAWGRLLGEGIGCPLQYSWTSLVAQLVKSLLQCWRSGFDPWVGKIPWRRASQPTPVFLPRESPWTEEPGGLESIGCKKSDITEWLSTHRWI